GIFLAAGFTSFAIQSLREREMRAAGWSCGLAITCAFLFGGGVFAPLALQQILLGLTILALTGATAAFFWPVEKVKRAREVPTRRFDERNILFARSRLIAGSREFQQYYADHPENLAADEAFRSRPGLLSPRAAFYHPILNASPEASFFLTGALRDAVDGPVALQTVSSDPEKISSYLCGLTRYYGALDAGITGLRPYHVYSHIGRGQGEWGAEIPVVHRYAIAFTVEMDFHMVAAAPYPPSIMESGRQYVEASRIGIQLAAAIRALGYSARAHIDGNYQVIAPLVARDAGLGEIGRMGLLMTPENGPRVRLGVVTTDLPLVPDPAQDYSYMIDACNLCKKCAACCPSGSIPTDERKEIDGALRWRINADTCFRYWCSIGTDCGRCLAVCPFSHPHHWTHTLIRRGIQHSGLFRRAALHLDDLFYGRKPPIKQAPGWTKIGGWNSK
ncbi:MAG: 4Fe-4S dicluster domain-containing protein, partial [Anaerolineaceae bacterium]|nr:4Fe-4S dicluster domain-containing protein [Anaerolineaceae bacterium]